MTQWKVVILTLADDQVCGYCVPDVCSCSADDLWPVIFCHGIPWNSSCHRKYTIQCKAVIQSQSTPYPWTSDITQLPFVYKVTTSPPQNYTDVVFCYACSVFDIHSPSTTHTSLSYQMCIKCNTQSQGMNEDVSMDTACIQCPCISWSIFENTMSVYGAPCLLMGHDTDWYEGIKIPMA